MLLYMKAMAPALTPTCWVAGLVSRHPHTTNVRALFYSGALDTPAAAISLRAIDPERYAIVNEEDGDVIEEIEESKAFYEVYDGAVYMFQVWSSSHGLRLKSCVSQTRPCRKFATQQASAHQTGCASRTM